MNNVFAYKRGSAGFTLMELVVAMAMIVVLSAIAIPRFMDALPKFRLQAAARDLYSNLQKAKVNAIKQHKDWGIEFHPASGSYSLCAENSFGTGNWGTGANITCFETYKLAAYGSGVSFGSGSATLAAVDQTPPAINPSTPLTVTYSPQAATFNPQATGTAGYCYLTNEDQDAFAVGTLSTGIVKLKKWTGSGWD